MKVYSAGIFEFDTQLRFALRDDLAALDCLIYRGVALQPAG